MKNTVSIRLPDTLQRQVRKLSRSKHVTISDVVRESLQRYVAAEQFQALRAQTIPYAEAQGFLTDEDVFEAVS